MLASQARYVAVMDADLQHDERLLVPMLEAFPPKLMSRKQKIATRKESVSREMLMDRNVLLGAPYRRQTIASLRVGNRTSDLYVI